MSLFFHTTQHNKTQHKKKYYRLFLSATLFFTTFMTDILQAQQDYHHHHHNHEQQQHPTLAALSSKLECDDDVDYAVWNKTRASTQRGGRCPRVSRDIIFAALSLADVERVSSLAVDLAVQPYDMRGRLKTSVLRLAVSTDPAWVRAVHRAHVMSLQRRLATQ